MNRFASISLFFLLLSFLIVGEGFAQLITDSDRRLKTQKAGSGPSGPYVAPPSKSPFESFRKKRSVERRTATTHPFSLRENKQTYPRYSAGQPFKKDNFVRTPRYSIGKPFKGENFIRTPKYSVGQPFKGENFIRTPRYSAHKPFKGENFIRSPRYSAGQPFKGENFIRTPRYSAAQPFKGENFIRSPRYSAGQPFKNENFIRTPRYSSGQPFKGENFIRTPRYSAGQPFKNENFIRTPRYSVGDPFKGQKYNRAPRYSSGEPFKNYNFVRTPRYSAGQPFKNENFIRNPRYSAPVNWSAALRKMGNPRYSAGQPFRGENFIRNPRYSQEIKWPNKLMNQSARYSVGNAYDGYKFVNIPPRYSTNKNRFNDNTRAEKENRIVEYETPFYTGETKIHWKKTKDMHPSFNYHYANQSLEIIRDGMREWNIYWVRITLNQEDPKGVKEKVIKPKFDKKEAEIWND